MIVMKKKAKDTKKGVIKRRLKFEGFKHCSEATQHEIDKPARKKIDMDSLTENHQEFMKNYRLILKS